MGYTGGGIGEYQYYNRFTDTWSDMSCDYTSSTYRCAKMDCHLPSENFKLLGYYKAAQNAQREWYGQLFKHEGVCVWNDEDTYENQVCRLFHDRHVFVCSMIPLSNAILSLTIVHEV